MTIETPRNLLSESAQELFDNIHFSRILGASKHISMIFAMMLDMVEHRDSSTLLLDLSNLAEYYKSTRGTQSRAIYNVLTIFTEALNKIVYVEPDQQRDQVKELIQIELKKLNGNIDRIVDYACNLVERYDSIMIFDYSSTINEFIKRMDPRITVYIAESRALDGGKPFLNAAINSGHPTVFFPDTTMLDVLMKVQVAFIGAESIYPSGEVINSIGSDILSILCQHLHKPLYVLSPMNKLDDRNRFGIFRNSSMKYDYSIKLAKDWDPELVKRIDFNGIKLVSVPASGITGIVTEYGVIPPYAMYSQAKTYLEGDLI